MGRGCTTTGGGGGGGQSRAEQGREVETCQGWRSRSSRETVARVQRGTKAGGEAREDEARGQGDKGKGDEEGRRVKWDAGGDSRYK